MNRYCRKTQSDQTSIKPPTETGRLIQNKSVPYASPQVHVALTLPSATAETYGTLDSLQGPTSAMRLSGRRDRRSVIVVFSFWCTLLSRDHHHRHLSSSVKLSKPFTLVTTVPYPHPPHNSVGSLGEIDTFYFRRTQWVRCSGTN